MKISFKPESLSHRKDPWGNYARLRAEAPCYRLNAHNVYLSRHREVAEGLVHPKLCTVPMELLNKRRCEAFSKTALSLEQVVEYAPRLSLLLDPPEHTPVRSLLSQLMRTLPARELKVMVEEETREVLMGVPLQGEFDYVEAVAEALPLRVILRLLGLSVEDKEFLQPHLKAVIRLFDEYLSLAELQRLEEGIGSYVEYFVRQLADKRCVAQSAFLQSLTGARRDGLKDEDAVAVCLVFLIAGTATTALSLGFVPEVLDRLSEANLEKIREDRAAGVLAGAEVARYYSPVQYVGRQAVADCEVGDFSILKGENVLLSLASANRDEAIFKGADEFQPDRKQKQSLAFGGGVHRCLGASLATMEMGELMHQSLRSGRFQTKAEGKLHKSHALRGYHSLQMCYEKV